MTAQLSEQRLPAYQLPTYLPTDPPPTYPHLPHTCRQVTAQLSEQLATMRPKALCRADKGFRVNFVGEAADDHGGPYREVHSK